MLMLILLMVVTMPFTDQLFSTRQNFEMLNLDSVLVEMPTQNLQPVKDSLKLFKFNPNEISQHEWELLGFSQKQAKAIVNYRTKAGDFNKPTDLLKLFVVDSARYLKLEPYITLESRSEQTVVRTLQLDVNSAEMEDWVRLPGIGTKRADRILKFRSALGGFTSTSQVSETYGLDSATFSRIEDQLTISDNSWQLISVNRMPPDSLAMHPYISEKLANEIVLYRENVGPFHTATDLKNMGLISTNLYVKLQAYISTK